MEKNLNNIVKAFDLKMSDLTEEFKAWAQGKLKTELNGALAVTNAILFSTDGKFYDSDRDRWLAIRK